MIFGETCASTNIMLRAAARNKMQFILTELKAIKISSTEQNKIVFARLAFVSH